MKERIGKFLCKIGLHKWGEPYATVSEAFGFPCGHHRQDCQRKGCTWVNNHRPY